jgi:hypothetical protein
VPKKDPAQNKEHLSNLLARYKERFKPPQASVEKAFVAAVQTQTGISLDTSQVTYSVHSKTIGLQVPSLIKTELKKKQQDIQHELQKTLPKSEVPTVIL